MQRSRNTQPMSTKQQVRETVGVNNLQVSPVIEKFLVERCNLCQTTISLDVGDVVQGDKWYHPSCLRSSEVRGSQKPTGK